MFSPSRIVNVSGTVNDGNGNANAVRTRVLRTGDRLMTASDRTVTRTGMDVRGGFTLVELLVVIFIILILTAVAVPVVLPALNSRRVNEAARELQAQLSLVREEAVRAGAPRGLRLLPDPAAPGPEYNPNTGELINPRALAYSRMINLQVPADYSEGFMTGTAEPFVVSGTVNFLQAVPSVVRAENIPTSPWVAAGARVGVIVERKYRILTVGALTIPIPNPPVNWFGNVRQGDKIRINRTGRTYTVIGPSSATYLGQPNPERLVSVDAYGYADAFVAFSSPSNVPVNIGNVRDDYYGKSSTDPTRLAEFLYVVNGEDDDNDGFVDEAFDGLNNTNLGNNDPGFNGIPDPASFTFPNFPAYDHPGERIPPILTFGTENEPEKMYELSDVTQLAKPTAAQGYDYTIIRRPAPSPGSREITLPGDVLIDATTTFAANSPIYRPTTLVDSTQTSQQAVASVFSGVNQRSRLPVQYSLNGPYVADIILGANGQILQTGSRATAGPPADLPFYHLWLTEREDIFAPEVNNGQLRLPFTNTVAGWRTDNAVLKSDRRLITIFAKTGRVVSNPVTSVDQDPTNPFNTPFVNQPFIDAQNGLRELR